MTDLERKLIETLRSQADEIPPHPNAWAEHERRMSRGRRHWSRPVQTALAAVAACLVLVGGLVVLDTWRGHHTGFGPAVTRVGVPAGYHVLKGPFRVTQFTDEAGARWTTYLVYAVADVHPGSRLLCGYARRDPEPTPAIAGGAQDCLSDPAMLDPAALLGDPYFGVAAHVSVFAVPPQVDWVEVDDATGKPMSSVLLARIESFSVFTVRTDAQPYPYRFKTLDQRREVLSQGVIASPAPRGGK